MQSSQPVRTPIRHAFARTVRDGRRRIRKTQGQLAAAAGISRGYVAAVERARANPTLDVVARISAALGLEAALVMVEPILVDGPHQRDLVHARCSGYVERRLRGATWLTEREVEVVAGRSHGWIDLIAFDRATETLLVIEIKTSLVDLGLVERQLGWYERSAGNAARRIGWTPRRIVSWLLVLATEEVEIAIRRNRDVLERAFPTRAPAMEAWLTGDQRGLIARGLAMIDPASKRRHWLIRSRADGRRSPARFRDYADAARHFAR